MNESLKVESRVRRLIHYIEDIEKGILQIPAFQRDFVWEKKNKLELFDSLREGYPIGSILLWKPAESYGEGLKIGPYTIPQKEDNYYYILDGFQRLSTLFGCLINPDKTRLEIDRPLWEKEFQICYDLKKEEFYLPRSKYFEPYQIPIYQLMDTRASYTFQRKLQELNFSEFDINIYLDRYEKLGSTLIDFQLPSIDITGGSIEKAVDIFSRLNSKGSIISPDWILSARTYEKDDNFRLGTLIDELLEDLKQYNFDGIKRDLVLQCIQSSFGKLYFEVNIEDILKNENFKTKAKLTISSIKRAVKFLFEEVLVIYSKLLPASIQLVFLTEFFNQVEFPTDADIEKLKRWFWITTYSNYFTVNSPSKRKDAFIHFKDFISGLQDNPVYYDRPDISFKAPELPDKITYGGVRANAYVLFLLNYSNNFNPVNSREIDEIKLFNIFGWENSPENIIPLIKYVDSNHSLNFIPNYKTKDLVEWIADSESDHTRFFLTSKMKEYLTNSSLTSASILATRRELIRKAESTFVESLDIIYYDPWDL